MAVNYRVQDDFLNAFFPSRYGADFYLTGGTALSRFYFHHRESYDLDLFTQNQDLDFSSLIIEIQKIASSLHLDIINQVTTNTYHQFIFENENKDRLKVEFVKDIPVRFGDMQMFGTIRVDSLENIGSNKILAVFGRTDHKDFIDLYYLLKQTDFTLDHLISLAKRKDVGLTEFYLANAIQDIEKASIKTILLKPLDQQEYLSFYQDLAKTLLLKIKPPQT